MNLQLNALTPLQRWDACLSTGTLNCEPDSATQDKLKKRALAFCARQPGGDGKPRIYLEFFGNQVRFRQLSSTMVPTSELFQGLLQELELCFPDSAGTSAVSLPLARPSRAKRAAARN